MAIKVAIDAGKTAAPEQVVSNAAIDRVQRQAAPELPATPLPLEETPLALSLRDQGYDVAPPAPSPEQVAEELSAGVDQGLEQTAQGVVEPTPLEQEQREVERIPPVSQRARVAERADEPGRAAFDRATAVTQVFDESAAGPTIATGVREKSFLEGDIETATRGAELAPSRLLFDPAILGAGEVNVSPEGKYEQRVNPLFGAVAGLVTENYFRNSGVVDGNNVEGGEIDFGETEQSQPGEEEVIKKAKQNTQLGRQVWQEWKREQAQLEGLPSDEHLLNQPQPSSDQLAAIGGLAKEAYAAANPDLVSRVEVKDPEGNTQVGFQLTAQAPKAFADGYKALSQPFESHEIPPLYSPTRSGQPQFEAKTRARATTTATGIKDPGRRIKEASQNYHEMKRIEDPGREKIFYTQAIPAILAGYEAVSPAIIEDTLTNPFRVGKTYTTLTFDLDQLPPGESDLVQADAYDVGVKRARGVVQEKLNNMQLLEEAIRDEQDAENPNQAKINALIDKYEKTIQVSPAQIYRSDVRTLLETLQTSANYSGKVLHGTYATQMLTGRLQLQQNKWNPQGNTRLRFVTGGPNQVRFTPGSNSVVERNFKEAMVSHFFPKESGAHLKPHKRLEQFADWKAGRSTGKVSWQAAVKAGKELNEIYNGIGADALAQTREILVGLNASSDIKLGEAIKPLQDIAGQLPQFSEETTAMLKDLGADELPYLIDWLQQIYHWDQGKPFRSSSEIEVDGITHGIASNALALGIESMALRAGAINPDPNRKLTPLEEAVGLDAVAGDVRDVMKDFMTNEAEILANGGNSQNADGLVKIAMQALEDRENYLKKSPMTLGYGQELNSLKQHVRATMATGKRAGQITQLLENNKIDQSEALDYLHALLVQSLEQALHPRVLETARQLRANNLMSTLTDEILYYDNGSGFRSNITALQDNKEKRKQARFTLKNENGDSLTGSTEIYEAEPAGSATRQYQPGGDHIPGGFGHGRSIPTMAQTYDAAMISGIATGATHADIKKRVASAGYEYSMQPVFDAAKADFATIGYVRDAMNKEWIKSLEQNDYVGQIMGPGGWYDQTITEFQKKLRDLPAGQPVEISPDNKWRGIYYFLNNENGAASMYRGARSRVEEKQTAEDGEPTSGKKEVKRIYGDLQREYGIQAGRKNPVTHLTPDQILGVVKMVSQHLRIRERNVQLANEVKRDRDALFKKIKQEDVWQVDF